LFTNCKFIVGSNRILLQPWFREKKKKKEQEEEEEEEEEVHSNIQTDKLFESGVKKNSGYFQIVTLPLYVVCIKPPFLFQWKICIT